MLNKLLSLALVITAIACAQQQKKIVIDENTGKSMLVGVADREDLADSVFGNWFQTGYDSYEIKSDLLEFDKKILDKLEIEIVMGTWCSDSRREVPRFYKIMDYLKFPPDKIKLVAVDRTKQGVSDETEGLEIELVPTIIFYVEGKEIGRIIETPRHETLEEDIAEILGGS